jgi:UDP-N-acetylmuramoyl-tripeptide--D-alanyl-D-alanine ligase
MGIDSVYKEFLTSKGVSTDTRNLLKGQIFIALRGDNFDGNEYVNKALSLGAEHVICSDNKWMEHKKVTVVNDTLQTLQQLATHHRSQFDIPVIALTGSNGKTTTKELISAVLSKQYSVVATIGNLNNHIGVPLTLLRIQDSTEIAIIEMGANHQREIAAISEIAKPTHGLITNFGKAHLEGFGGIEGVKKGKSELYDYLAANNRTSFVLHNQPELLERSQKTDQVLTSTEIELIPGKDLVAFNYHNRGVKTQLTGDYNFGNILYAIAIGEYFNIQQDNIIKAISEYMPTNHRSQIIEKDAFKIILDAYNANPSSIEVALKNLSKQTSYPKKIAILGDMFEMGDYAQREHQNVVNLAEQLGIEAILIGENFYETNTNFNRYKSYESFKAGFKQVSLDNSVVLIKGSRGMKLERILELLN